MDEMKIFTQNDVNGSLILLLEWHHYFIYQHERCRSLAHQEHHHHSDQNQCDSILIGRIRPFLEHNEINLQLEQSRSSPVNWSFLSCCGATCITLLRGSC